MIRVLELGRLAMILALASVSRIEAAESPAVEDPQYLGSDADNTPESDKHRAFGFENLRLPRFNFHPIQDAEQTWDHLFPGPSKGLIGWAKNQAPFAADETANFLQLYSSIQGGGHQIPAEAKNDVFLLVGGLVNERLPGYFGPSISRLQSLGLNVNADQVNAGSSVMNDQQVVYSKIMSITSPDPAGPKAVVIAHSEGCLDITAAMALHPDLKQRVRAVIVIQPPYGGTAIANDSFKYRPLWTVVSDVFGVFDSYISALEDMTYKSRMDFVTAHPYPADVPTVSLATSEDLFGYSLGQAQGWHVSTANLFLFLQAGGRYAWDRYQAPCDGLVTTDDEIIPGTMFVRLQNMSHADTVFESRLITGRWIKPAPYNPEDITEALVTLVFQRPAVHLNDRAIGANAQVNSIPISYTNTDAPRHHHLPLLHDLGL